jgi:hypothetical protein
MADHDWRSLERRWQADPGDQDALHRAIAARRRAGVPVSGWMLDQCEYPARRFDSPASLDVFVVTLDGRQYGVGRTPAGGDGLSLPPHRTWWVQPDSDLHLGDVADLVHDAEIPGLALAPQVTDDDLAHLAGLPLQRLDLGGCTKITAKGLAHVGALRALTFLSLWYCRAVDDAALARLAGLEELTTLNLSHCVRIGPGGLAPLAGLRALSALSCQGLAKLGDAGLTPLAELPRLAVLDLQRCGITDAGLEHLGALAELTLLNVSFCTSLTPKGLRALAGLERLTQVYALGSGLDSNAVGAVQRTSLPRCEIRV